MTELGCNGGGGNEDASQRLSRMEKRKMLKKLKRKEKRKDMAVKEKEEEEMKINDPEELRRMEVLEQEERERVERERMEFEERERQWMERLAERKKREEAEAERQMKELENDQLVLDEDYISDGYDYVEEGPAEIIWQGNEIIVKKKKVKIPKKKDEHTSKEEAERPTSNPLPPQSEAFTDSLDVPVFSAKQAYDNLAQQVPSFGTEQDKAHCPFHIKTGVCRFGARCNRAHFYPDKSCTLLIKNMYSGPGLAWEQDEALEVKCEYTGVTRWKIAICGEYMKTRLSTCSRGTACNFIHCFRNPGGDYEWADWDKPPPKYWVKKMSALFGYTDDVVDEFWERSPSQFRDKISQNMPMPDAERYCYSRRSCSRDRDTLSYRSHRDHCEKKDLQDDSRRQRHKNEGRRHVGRKSSRDTLKGDCMGTVKSRESNREHTHSRRSLERKIRNTEFNEEDAERDKSSKELCGETHCSLASNQSRHEVEVTRKSRVDVSKVCDSVGESNKNAGSAIDGIKDGRTVRGSKDEGTIFFTNWDKGSDGTKDLFEGRDEHRHRDEIGERHTHKHHEENWNKCNHRDKCRTSRKNGDQFRNGTENSHKLQLKRRRSFEHTKESYGHSRRADKKKKTYSPESNDNYSDEDRHPQLNSPINVEKVADGVGDDRWEPS